MQETQEVRFRSLGREDPLEEEMATHSSMLAWETPWTEEPGGLQSMGSRKSRRRLNTHTMGFLLCFLTSPPHLYSIK